MDNTAAADGLNRTMFGEDATSASPATTTSTTTAPAVVGRDHYSFFPVQDNKTTVEFTLGGVLRLDGKYMQDFWELFLAILVWMAVTYITVHVVATVVALVKLRNHPYGIFVAAPILLMCILGPATLGAISSAALAFALHAGGSQFVSPWHCAFLGIIQTAISVFVSFSRVLASL